jgi:hypothetical protein
LIDNGHHEGNPNNPIDNKGDVDGDGLPNSQDPDIDGDGIPNAQDPDIDGDGIANAYDPTPNGVATGGGLPDTGNLKPGGSDGTGGTGTTGTTGTTGKTLPNTGASDGQVELLSGLGLAAAALAAHASRRSHVPLPANQAPSVAGGPSNETLAELAERFANRDYTPIPNIAAATATATPAEEIMRKGSLPALGGLLGAVTATAFFARKRDMLVMITDDSHIKRVYVTDMTEDDLQKIQDKDSVLFAEHARISENILLFTNRGHVIYLPIKTLQNLSMDVKGQHISDLSTAIDKDEKVIFAKVVASSHADERFELVTESGLTEEIHLADLEPVKIRKQHSKKFDLASETDCVITVNVLP